VRNLCLSLINQNNSNHHIQGERICKTEVNEIKKDQTGSFIFTALHNPFHKVVIESNFQSGTIYRSKPENDQIQSYPLKYLDSLIFVNWLAPYQDILLHASGAIINKMGYAFLGPSGAGKSTLAEAIHQTIPSIVMGEDQLVLSSIAGQFWVFGTPWHENPAMCSPAGAPLKKLFFLDRDSSKPPSCTPISSADGVQRILQTAFIPYYRQDLLPGILDRLAYLAEQVPFYRLNYHLGSDPEQFLNSV
jgi:hypothetical protein